MPNMKKSTAIKHFGSEAEIARLLKISPQAVNKWPAIIPIKQAWKLHDQAPDTLSMGLRDYR
jgi:hypothetical protein